MLKAWFKRAISCMKSLIHHNMALTEVAVNTFPKKDLAGQKE